MEQVIHTLIARIQQTKDSEGNPCTRVEAEAIAAELVRLLVLNHPLRDEYAQDLLDERRFVAFQSH
jgi:hypothetical protein